MTLPRSITQPAALIYDNYYILSKSHVLLVCIDLMWFKQGVQKGNQYICINIQGEHMSHTGHHQYSTEMNSNVFLKQIRTKHVSMYLTFWLGHPDVHVKRDYKRCCTENSHATYKLQQSVLLKLQLMIHNEVHFDSSYGTAGYCVSSTRIFLSDACSNQHHFRQS